MNKKTILYCALAFALASCGGKKASGDEVAVEEAAPHSELNLSAELVSHLDSIAGIISSTAPNVDFKALVENGKFSLTDQQKKYWKKKEIQMILPLFRRNMWHLHILP